ncbi:MAG: aminopeptidase, partial [Actinomycetota bacterium]|nr:aminopeptidase [Actinomycetota bacterium]
MATTASSNGERLERFAELVLKVGINLKEGQDVQINGLIEHAPFARALADQAYRLGARSVDVTYLDPHVRKSRIEHAPRESLGWIPPWINDRLEWSVGASAAHITIAGDPEPDLLADVDPKRASLERTNFPPARLNQVASEQVNWTIIPYPSPGWAKSVYGEPDVDRLWKDIERFMRLDQPDPVAAWEEHIAKLVERARQLNER